MRLSRNQRSMRYKRAEVRLAQRGMACQDCAKALKAHRKWAKTGTNMADNAALLSKLDDLQA
jgi:hypothetical protein